MRVQNLVNVCLDIFWTVESFVIKLGVMMYSMCWSVMQKDCSAIFNVKVAVWVHITKI